MVNLKEKPFNLSDEQIEQLENTISGMTVNEKFRQLFILLDGQQDKTEADIRDKIESTLQGGLRWQGGGKDDVYKQNEAYQKYSKTPLLIAANCDDGGIGAVPEGTFVATAVQAAAGETTETAYRMGYVSAKETSAIGCNWLFNPVVDIYMNWRNTIVNTRSFGDNADTVIKNARAFIQGVKDANPDMACCAKHFPGDGVEELDHHLVMGINDLDTETWNETFGKVYRTMIDDGIESIMIGHFAFPAMCRKFKPGIKAEELMPATLSPEILTDLLREEMGFNGVILTDATHMIGFSAVMKRKDSLPLAIASGCDMILFSNVFEEDLQYVLDGYKNGIITDERLNDAVTRVIGLKARLGLFESDVLVPSPELKDSVIGCDEHKRFAEEAAEKCVTLVKDSSGYIPVNPAEKKRALLVFVQSTPTSKAYSGDPAKQIVIEELSSAGFEVEVAPNFHDLEVENGATPRNFGMMMQHWSRDKFAETHDVVFLVFNIKGYAQENNVRLRWSLHHSIELPWYIPEVPTIGISLNYTNHLIDVPQLKTMVHAYAPQRENIRAAVEKICGKSSFRGTASETVFCGRWETIL